jgi:hypothetical protein
VERPRDSETRQRTAIESYARTAGYVIVDWLYDPAVKGSDAVTELRCRCGECCKGGLDGPTPPPNFAGRPPFMRAGWAVESRAPLPSNRQYDAATVNQFAAWHILVVGMAAGAALLAAGITIGMLFLSVM